MSAKSGNHAENQDPNVMRVYFVRAPEAGGVVEKGAAD
jgi:hypothetical protein